MNKLVLAGLTLILVRDCDIGGPRFHGPIEGTWGGENAGLMAFDTTAHVHIGCTAGDTKQALVADEQGQFDVPGRYNVTLYPVARGPDHPARTRDSPNQRAPDGVLALESRPGGRDPAHLPRAGHRLRCVQPARARFPLGPDPSPGRPRPGRLAAQQSALSG